MTRSAKKTASFLAAHAAPLPAHVTRESVLATLHAMPNLAARAPAIAYDASHESHHDSEGRALFTVTRPRVLDRDGLTELHLCDGRLVAAFARVPTVRAAFDSVIGYLAQALPADCDPAAEAESYRASFRENWESTSVYPMFRASCLTRAARWAFRLAAAEAEAPAPEPFRAPCKGEAGYTEPAPVVDVTPTWAAVARIIELGLVNGNATGRQIAREELARMARLADSAVAAAKAKANPGEVVDLARACLAAYPKTDKAFTGKGPACDAARDLRDALVGLVAIL